MALKGDNKEPLLDDEAPQPLLERQGTGMTFEKYCKYLGYLFSDAAGVVIGWQWSRVLHGYIDEAEINIELAHGKKVEFQMQNLDPDVFGVVYAGLLTLLAVF